MSNRPVRNQVYSLERILLDLHLLDSPCLEVRVNDSNEYVNQSHLSVAQFLALPGWRDTLWTYRFTTHEWIPVFTAVNPDEIMGLCEIVHNRSLYPKGTYVPPVPFEYCPTCNDILVGGIIAGGVEVKPLRRNATGHFCRSCDV